MILYAFKSCLSSIRSFIIVGNEFLPPYFIIVQSRNKTIFRYKSKFARPTMDLKCEPLRLWRGKHFRPLRQKMMPPHCQTQGTWLSPTFLAQRKDGYIFIAFRTKCHLELTFSDVNMGIKKRRDLKKWKDFVEVDEIIQSDN